MPDGWGDWGGGSGGAASFSGSGPSASSGFTVPTGGGDTSALTSVGKTSTNLEDPVGSMQSAVQNMVGLAGSAGQKALGAIGSIGIPGLPSGVGPNLGGVAGTIGTVANAGLSVVGAGVKALQWPEQQVESWVAQQRVDAYQHGDPTGGVIANAIDQGFSNGSANPLTVLSQLGNTTHANAAALPQQAQTALDQGASANQVIDALMQSGGGFSQNKLGETVSSSALDPMNLIAPGASDALDAIKGAGKAVQLASDATQAAKVAEDIGVPTRIVGGAYNALTGELSGAGKWTVDKLLGGVTSDFFHAYGVGNYRALSSALSEIDPAAAKLLDDAASVALQNHYIASVVEGIGSRVRAGTQALGNVKQEIQIGLDRIASGKGARSIDLANDIRARVTDLSGVTDRVEYAANAIDKITGMGMTQARLAAGKLALSGGRYGSVGSDRILQLLDDLTHASAIKDEQAAIAAVRESGVTELAHEAGPTVEDGFAGTPLARETPARVNVNLDRLTLLRTGSGSRDEARALIDSIKAGGPGTQAEVVQALSRWDILRSAFAGKEVPTNSQLVTFLEDNLDRFPQEVHLPTTGGNPLPQPLQDFLGKWGDTYHLGFSPEDGVKSYKTADGEFFYAPWAYESATGAGANIRNPLGRFVDFAFRDINQRQIITNARDRMVSFMGGLGFTENEAQRLMSSLIHAGTEARTNPRGLSGLDDIFAQSLGASRFAEFTAKGGDPTYAVMHAFEGDLSTVGLTQKFTGIVKTISSPVARGGLAGLTDNLYPKFRFGANPLFQAQIFIESPFFAALRGTDPFGWLNPERVKLYQTLMPGVGPVFEEYSKAMAAGSDTAAEVTRASGILSRLKDLPVIRNVNVQQMKQIEQIRMVMHDFAPDLVNTIKELSPDVYRSWVATYGSDAGSIADGVLNEMVRRAGPSTGFLEDVLAHAHPDASPAESLTNQVVADLLDRHTRQAYNTINLSTERNWFERSLNHPFLGLYPFNYYEGKVLPEFARFLFKEPFGLHAPGLGASQLFTMHDHIVGQMAADPNGFAKVVKDNPALIHTVNMFLPGTPWDMNINAPAYVRHIDQAVQTTPGGIDKVNFPAQANSAIGDWFKNNGAFSGVGTILAPLPEAGHDLYSLAGTAFEGVQNLLNDAAQSWDRIFNSGQ